MESVLLVRPRNGPVEEDSAFMAYQGDIGDRFKVTPYPSSRSLLTYNFNWSWCHFVNGDYDLYFMLHADVAPVDPRYLSILRDQMGDRFDVMHAPCCIKDDRNITSTGLAKRHHQYGPLRRLHVSELKRMPQPFGFEEAAAVIGRRDSFGGEYDCLIPNTGCLLIRRTMKTIQFHGFRQHDKIVGVTGYEVRDGKPRVIGHAMPSTESEDWNFGRWCARNGVRVGGTTAVVTRHYGQRIWYSDMQCPDGRDEEAFPRQPEVTEGVETL